MMAGTLRSVHLQIEGRVQGVGFRPFIWHLAAELGIKGDVGNDGDGVYIHAWAPDAILMAFEERIRNVKRDVAA